MHISRVPVSRFLALAIALAAASFASIAAGAGQVAPAAATDTANKALIPHAAWNCQMADGIPFPDTGKLVFEIDMKIDQAYDVGTTPYGKRDAYVIQGGTVKGEKIDATVMSGGLDFQLTLANGVVEIEQILVWRTSDNRYIYMRQAGVGASARDVRVVMDMEAPNGSATEWVNTGKYVARRVLNTAAKTLKMSVYDVAGVTIDAGKSVIAKPAGVPTQPWDYRIAAATERQGEILATENVTLGGGQSVGASKRGSRNVLPITGGTLTGGLIPGKVLAGGADYQNLSQAPTIDARYLWQTTEGDIIIVRNAGGGGGGGRGGAGGPGAARGPGGPPAPGGPGAARGGGGGGGLVPYFEVRTDSKYAWLNSGKYLSSPPGMGAGGVSLTFYKSVE
jgi:hypothetical protein